jgi:carboxyl-terminal processing protease
MKLRASRAIISLVVVLFVSGVLGGLFGSQLHATTKGEADIDASAHLLSRLLDLLEQNYATDVDADHAVYGAIDGMLRTLDPHSKFFDPKAFNSLREDQRGKYYGLGISVTVRFGKVTVVSPPFPNSPAEKVGLRVGDLITHVDGKSTQGLDINEVVSRLKGPRGTAVHITIQRPGVPEPMQLDPVRDEISKYTINYVFLLRPGIGYIRLDSFAETSGNELREALRKLRAEGPLEGLIFDLRGNPGGLLNEAIEVAETFLQKNQVILETKGRTRGSVHTYTSSRTNSDNLYPIVTLINPSSASASEIVAGALQDHDRSLILGQTSFGKGLVQSVYPLSKNTGLALTTQKWYTPSGRLIQRDYSQISQYDYYNHRDNPTDKQKQDIHQSDHGRVVYGGGGITPDHVIEEPKLSDFEDMLINKKFAFFTFVRDFLANNPAIDKSFQVSDAMVNDFKQHLRKRGIQYADKDFDASKDFIKREIRREVFYNRLGTVESEHVRLEADPLVLKAIEYLPEAKDLSNSKGQRKIAQK